jgi:hypothetical protein
MEEVAYLILTIAVELPVALVLLRQEDWRRVALIVVGLNMVSHPIVWQMIFALHTNWFLSEACVFAFEGIVLALAFKDRRGLAFATGALMNLVTAAIGYFGF